MFENTSITRAHQHNDRYRRVAIFRRSLHVLLVLAHLGGDSSADQRGDHRSTRGAGTVTPDSDPRAKRWQRVLKHVLVTAAFVLGTGIVALAAYIAYLANAYFKWAGVT